VSARHRKEPKKRERWPCQEQQGAGPAHGSSVISWEKAAERHHIKVEKLMKSGGGGKSRTWVPKPQDARFVERIESGAASRRSRSAVVHLCQEMLLRNTKRQATGGRYAGNRERKNYCVGEVGINSLVETPRKRARRILLPDRVS